MDPFESRLAILRAGQSPALMRKAMVGDYERAGNFNNALIWLAKRGEGLDLRWNGMKIGTLGGGPVCVAFGSSLVVAGLVHGRILCAEMINGLRARRALFAGGPMRSIDRFGFSAKCGHPAEGPKCDSKVVVEACQA